MRCSPVRPVRVWFVFRCIDVELELEWRFEARMPQSWQDDAHDALYGLLADDGRVPCARTTISEDAPGYRELMQRLCKAAPESARHRAIAKYYQRCADEDPEVACDDCTHVPRRSIYGWRVSQENEESRKWRSGLSHELDYCPCHPFVRRALDLSTTESSQRDWQDLLAETIPGFLANDAFL